MEKQLITEKRGRNTLKGVSVNKRGADAQGFSMEIGSLLDVFARIELRRQGKRRVSKEVR